MDPRELDMNDGMNERPEIDPIGIPFQEGAPSIGDRLSRVEDILHVNE